MRLIDKFESWWNRERLSRAYGSFRHVARDAFEAGHAASGRNELLAACEYMEEVLRYAGGEDGKAYGMVTAAIKKARGES